MYMQPFSSVMLIATQPVTQSWGSIPAAGILLN